MPSHKYKKKPVTVEAIQFTNDNIDEVLAFCKDAQPNTYYFEGKMKLSLIIPTLEGDYRALYGDWIIKGVKGEFYPCKDDIFRMTYEIEKLNC